ncbi:hypothetical protein BCR37DRAFT_347119 [Protomyces lactucae-debilis]|uniref:PDEase domain-containing protein n=1 Tax=Protomyces lactucae-debilis TaxID=2754530 RepID=A0A1Y2FGN1_PROLT|nr:uncharacterized protein BCR37DRAFT_347119 [Protomyces lactucae-debilis]ORY82446.1 hypothetical protein BCR37DRAFT_347119 [Protomyces lactucae-debilis]
MFKHVLAQPGLEPWHLSDDALRSFISTVRSAYHRLNPYHNFRHAVDVLQALFYFTLSSSALPSFAGDHLASQRTLPSAIADLFTPQYILALMIVGLGHDVGHPGVNNAFLVATQAPLAVLYNDRSVLENLHGAALSRILCKHWPATQEPVMRKIILELVLSTDMALHFDYMTKFSDINSLLASNELKQNANSASISKLRLIIFAGLVKCADICNVARPLEVSKLWSSALLREFFNQGYLERSLGMPITKSFDPKQTVQAESQIFFTEMFAIPLFDSLKAALPILEPLIAQMQSNKAYWSAMRQNTVEPNKTSSAAAGQQTDSEVLMKSPNQTGCFSVFQRKR